MSGWLPAGYLSTSRLVSGGRARRTYRRIHLDEIHLVQPLQESFRRNDSLCSLVEDPVFIQALPHFRFIQQSLLAFVPADSPPE